MALPSAGGIAVIDAQAILDQDGGAREPCRIDRWLPLEVDVTANPEPEPTPSDACVEDPVASGPTSAAFAPEPAGMTLSDGTLYVADTGAPVIHRVDLPSPCEPRELAPLLATSHEDPTRIVTTSRVAVIALTLEL